MNKLIVLILLAILFVGCGGEDNPISSADVDTDTDTDTDADTDKDLKNMWECLICVEDN